MADENEAEGCARETYGAVAARWEAEHAREPATRAMLRGIAGDECRHARLSWEAAQWLETQMGSRSRGRVTQVRVEALQSLQGDLEVEPCAGWQIEAGTPSAHQALALLAAMRRDLALDGIV